MTEHTETASSIANMVQRAMNEHNAAKISEHMAENVTFWEANMPAPINGRKAVEEHFRENWKTFPDATIRSVNRVIGGDHVVDEVEWTGTNKGPMEMPGAPPIPPTGKRARGKAVSVVKLEGDKIKTMNIYYDTLGFLAQLGIMEPPGSG